MTVSSQTNRHARLESLTAIRRGHPAGITLVDLVITVFITGILAAVAAPRFFDTVAQLKTEAVARRIAGDLNYARRVAIQNSHLTSITFGPAGYAMTGVEDPARPGQSYSVGITDIDNSVSLTSYSFDGNSTVTFNAYGSPLVGSSRLHSGAIVVQYGTHVATVLIDPSSGEPSVQ